MRKRILYGAGVILLILLGTLIVWEGSFTFGGFAPTNPEQTFLYWTVFTLVFLLTVTLGFMLIRTGLRLYVDRRSNKEGSRIRTKLVAGALALSFIPVFFLVLWSVSVLNYNLAKWFSRPGEGVRDNLEEVIEIVQKDAREDAATQAAALAALPETHAALAGGPVVLAALCEQLGVRSAALLTRAGNPVPVCGTALDLTAAVRAPVLQNGSTLGFVAVAPRLRADIVAKQRSIQEYIRDYDRLNIDRKSFRNLYLMLLAVIALFVLFVATWIALFLAKQISNPITALLEAAAQVRKGNLGYRLQVKAIDEMATLVRAFNEMTEALDANSRELERRRRFTEAILESIPTGVISISAEGRIQRVNRALRELFPQDKLAAATRLEDLFTREDTAEIKFAMKRARRTGVAARPLELRSEHGTLQLTATVAALEEKLTSGFVIVLEDTTDLLRMQKMAAWHEVARRIAHEIKNPLTPIALCGERIARQIEKLGLAPETRSILDECTTTIASEVETVKTLVDEFSQFARFPTARLAYADLNDIVEAALAVFSGRLDGITIRKELAPNLPPVNVDREQIKRVVVNLVDNAAEALQDSLLKHIYIGTQAAGSETLELTIADTGRGISPEDKDRLFLPYFSTKGRGTGLGLAIVSHILSEHHATIRVEDNRPQGARFLVEIPVAASSESEARPAEARA
jgi:PAS domain S-box-containing protein